MSDNNLVALDPSDVISLGLSRDAAPKMCLRITNVSNSPVAFKVKTTQPTWYYVRPNQDVVEPNKTEEVTVVLIAEHCNNFIDMTEEERAASLDKHRFLVQSKAITDQLYNKIKSLPPNGRADEFAKVWENASKNGKKNQKLKVEFIMNDAPTANDGPRKAIPTVAENVEAVRNRISSLETKAKSNSQSSELPSSPDAIVSELQSLRKKYDAVVEYTVHLTAERDYHFTQLEDVRREYAREKSRRSKPNSPSSGINTKQRTADKTLNGGENAEIQQGFSLLAVIIVAVFSFMVARYTSRSNDEL